MMKYSFTDRVNRAKFYDNKVVYIVKLLLKYIVIFLVRYFSFVEKIKLFYFKFGPIYLNVSNHDLISELYLDNASLLLDDTYIYKCINRNDNVVIVGAGPGVTSLLVSGINGPKGQTVMFESHPDVFAILVSNFSRNPKLLARAIFRNTSLGKSTGVSYTDKNAKRINTKVSTEYFKGSIKVVRKLLDEEILPSHINHIIITAYKSELDILEGSINTFKNTDQVFIRVINGDKESIEKMIYILEYSNFYVFVISGNTLYYLKRDEILPVGDYNILAIKDPDTFASIKGYEIKLYNKNSLD